MITCKICQKELLALSFRHLLTHRITPGEYKRKYRVNYLVSRVVRVKISDFNIGNKRALGYRHKAGFKKRISVTNKELWANKDFRAKIVSRQKRYWTPKRRKEISRVLKTRLAGPEIRLKMSKAASRNWENAGYRRKMANRMRTLEGTLK